MSPTPLAPTPLAPTPPCRGLISNLLFRCGNGDELALGDLFDLTYFVVADRLTRGTGSSPGIDEKVVEVFARIWHRADTYRPSEDGPLRWILEQVIDPQETYDQAVAAS